MHIPLRWVVTENTTDGDNLLTLGEPALWSEPCLGLRWAWRHFKEGRDTNEKGYEALDEEEPP